MSKDNNNLFDNKEKDKQVKVSGIDYIVNNKANRDKAIKI